MIYSRKTQALIDRMCRNVERSSFVLDKLNAEECILKTYDIFGVKRPRKIVWSIDIFDEKFVGSARSAGSAWSARSARSAGSARSAWSAGSAGSARSAGSAGSARSAGSALDYDFDWYIFEYEYCQNPDKDKLPNQNDFKYLEYCELLMQAKEYGLGYRIEWQDTLYLVPTPIVKIDAQNRFHSEHLPAINWMGGEGFYYLHGVNFSKELWLKVISRQMTMQEILAIQDIDQRTQAIKYAKNGLREFYKSQGGERIDHYVKMDGEGRPINYELWKLPKGEIFTEQAFFAVYECPSAREKGEQKEYAKGVPEFKTVSEAMAWGMSDSKSSISAEEWRELTPLVHES